MSLPTSLNSFRDCADIFEKALDFDLGARVAVTDWETGNRLRARMHQARVLHRKEAARMYPKEDPRHGISAWDPLICRVKQSRGQWYLYVETQEIADSLIEPIPADDDALPGPAPMPQLEDQREKVVIEVQVPIEESVKKIWRRV